jgi:STE24 endopeptidase
LHPIVYFAAILLLAGLCDLPADLAAHAVSRHFSISIQGWASWFWDWWKGQMITIGVGALLLWPFYALLRWSSRRWWLWAWLAALPLMLFATYLDPLIVEPLFNKYEPLDAKHPALTDQIEQLLRRAGVQIPRDRIVEMEASEKTHALNAYVSGIGGSRRVVLYDTIIQKEEGPPLLTTIGHELGHAVLHHIDKGLVFGAILLLIGLYLAYLLMNWIVDRWGAALDIHAVADRASLPVLLLLVAVISFLGEPVGNAFSRWDEHQADQYSL